MAYYPKNQIGANDFDTLRLSVASDADIMGWSYGEVLKAETINYRTQKPERDGLFCERIFGPVKDINPHDSRFKGVRSREAALDRNGNLVTKALARRERMGHITLAVPVAHSWFMRGTPSALGTLLNMTVKQLEKVIYYASYVILDVDTTKRDQYIEDITNTNTAARVAIKARYEAESNKEDADVKKLAEDQAHELDELDKDFIYRKNILTNFNSCSLIDEVAYRKLPEEYVDLISVEMGAGAIHKLLAKIDLTQLVEELKTEKDELKGLKRQKVVKRLKILEGMERAKIKPVSLIMTVIPVIPPDLRPMVSLAGGRFATSDINDLYRRIINRNNRLKKLLDLKAPEVITRNEKRILQESVDALIDNSSARSGRQATNKSRRKLKSLSDILKGKQGRFRQNLLGKRVDYSGRSVIVVGPHLNIDQCGLPRKMALELFKPFVISWLIQNEYANTIRTATQKIEAGDPIIWDALDEVIEDKFVLLNRAPSLHRLSIQAFKPRLTDSKAIQLHPLVANGFNADYDGDQMAVHLPLSAAAQDEARTLMSATRNLLKPADGEPVLSIYQDVVLGNYYLTHINTKMYNEEYFEKKKKKKSFSSIAEAEMALDNGDIKVQTPILIDYKGEKRDTSLGRIYFNEALPKDFKFVNETQSSKVLKETLADVFNQYGAEKTTRVADKLKNLSFKYETLSTCSTSKDDYLHYPEVDDLVAEGDAKSEAIEQQFQQGLISDEERYELVVANWRDIDGKISDFLKTKTESDRSTIALMVNSGARGSISNVKLASAMIGIMVDIYNQEIELPIRSNFKSGLSTLESFVAARGARQGLVSTALKTADSGYLTRRLVDVAQDVFTTEEDAIDNGFRIERSETEETMVDFSNRLAGRFAAEEVKGHVQAGELITREIADKIEADESITYVRIKSALTVKSLRGIPQKSYGVDLSTGCVISTDEPIGVIAAQSVGEPGTQLTLDTFHSSGVAGSGAVAQGLPRVEELLEARQPKGQAIVAPMTGLVEMWEDGDNVVIQITPEAGTAEKVDLQGRTVKIKNGAKIKKGQILAEDAELPPIVASYDGVANYDPTDSKTPTALMVVGKAKAPAKIELSKLAEITVKSGDRVEAGDRLTAGSLNLQELMVYKGIKNTERYILNNILRIYAGQGAEIDAKHLEIIIRQMFSRVQIDNPGDSLYSTGEIVSRAAAEEENEQLVSSGKQAMTYNQLLLGITKVSIYSDSFLSAASFQDTTRVLINAAIRGKEDKLIGLKENVIIGRRIPVGTGVRGEEFEEEFMTETDSKPEVEIVDKSPEGAVDKDDLLMDTDVN